MTSLLGLLVMLIVLGVMGAIAVSALNGPGSSVLPSSTTLANAGPSSNTPTGAALQATCVADFQSLAVALQVYTTLHGAPPPAGTAWATGVQSGTTLIQSWPSDPGHFTFTWNGTALGVRPEHGTACVASAGSADPPTGCDATLS